MATDSVDRSPRRASIYAIDDDPDLLALLAATLRAAGHQVATFDDPLRGIERTIHEPPDLLFTDLLMPTTSGLDVIAAVRRVTELRKVPILVLSARGEEEVILQCFAEGASDFLVKPFSPGALRAKVHLLLARAASERSTSDPAAVPGARAGGFGGAPADPAPPYEPVPGRAFAGYQVVRKLGEGGMGVVFQGLAPDGRAVALKILPEAHARDRALLARFLREAEHLKAVRHENIAAFYEVGHDRGRYYLAMEFVDGISLDRLPRRPPVPEREAIQVILGVSRALEALEAAAIIHRDIKASNVMVSRAGQVKLVDFGLTYRERDDRITAMNVVMGTPSYVAPEQIRGGAKPDRRADLYAVGVLFYYLVAGRLPFEGESDTEVIFKHVEQAPLRPGVHALGLGGEVEAEILRLLAKRPDDRHQSAAELTAALLRLLPGGGGPETLRALVGEETGGAAREPADATRSDVGAFEGRGRAG